MQTSELTARLRQWTNEFQSVSGEAFTVPDRYYQFIAARVAELGVTEPDPDIVRMRTFSSGWRNVRVTGVRGGMLHCEFADGGIGFNLCPVKDIHDDDRGKLTGILERMRMDGKIRETAP